MPGSTRLAAQRVGECARWDDGYRQRRARLYFEYAAFAHAFVARFCCGYQVETIAIASAIAIGGDARPARRSAPVHRTP